MRLDFNILLIDDDINDDEENEELNRLKSIIEKYVIDKGFHPHICTVEDINEASEIPKNRIDLFISDNNLKGDQKGINYYLNISQDFICDFILYTRSEIKSITNEIISHLQNPLNNPNIFSRFSFTERKSDGVWITDIKRLIDHILSRREEINNFRGLYAQLTAKIHRKIQNKFSIRSQYNFCDTIVKACESGLDEELGQRLHKIRMLRNSLMHNDETLSNQTQKYKITCCLQKDKKTNRLITRDDNFDKRRLKNEFIDIDEDNLKSFRDEVVLIYDEIERTCS